MDNIKEATKYLNDVANEIEEKIASYLSVKEPPVIFEAMRYAVLGGGKRLRAALCYLGAFGEEYLAIPAACAVEMIHAYSLVHDDLPIMDDDDYRRGKPSCHIAFGEANALLAGDALLTKAFEIVLDLKNNPVLAAKELALAAGAEGMVGGQVLDLYYEGAKKEEANFKTLYSINNKPIGVEDLKILHSKKTGALITVSLKLGAIAAKREDLLEKYTEYGNLIGLLFQVTDDILDVVGTAKALGKTPGKDASAGKVTYTTLLGLEASLAFAKEIAEKAEIAAEGLPGESILKGLANYILVRES